METNFVRVRHQRKMVGFHREMVEKKEDLTRNTMVNSGRAENVGDGRKLRRSMVVGDDKDQEVDDSLPDSLRARVHEIQSRTAEL
jgi:hypothetical protein